MRITEQCPYHDLAPHMTVVIRDQNGRLLHIASAQLLCETWHDTAPLREWFRKSIEVMERTA